ncbi:nucleotidyltransferase domain-containing protein [Cnuibacter sp. UC19_7]|uniref:nucleotidyltransferase domain-containing protein n=1 Tax=Cnuibacter sp. UC19_7 TaxID=3350166 RepID=UPI0036715890
MPSAAQILREARVTAGLTQSQLAARASSTQSVVSAYEGSRREPSLRTLVRLVGAAGMRLDIRISARTEASSRLRRRLDENADELKASLGALGARSIRLVGSVARGDATETSDIDLLVDLDEGARLSDLARLRHEAERILQTPVDVVPLASLKTRMRRRALDDAIPL